MLKDNCIGPLPRDFIEHTVQHTKKFLQDSLAAKAVLHEAVWLADKITNQVDGVQMIFGSGFPHYVLGLDNFKIPEFDRFFTEETEIKIKANGSHNICPSCLSTNKPQGSIKSHCQPCGSQLKPIDLIRTLPDTDLIVVLDELRLKNLKQIRGVLDRYDYQDPDTHLTEVMLNTYHFMDSVLNHPETKPVGYLHADVYAMSMKNLLMELKLIENGELSLKPSQTVAFHNEPVKYEAPFAADLFLTEYQPVVQNNDFLSKMIQTTIKGFVTKHGPINAYTKYLDLLSNIDKKNYRIIVSSRSVQENIWQKINSYID